MRNPHGYIRIVGDGPQQEHDTVECAHCNAHYIVAPFTNPTDVGGWCWNCGKPICTSCSQLNRCLPYEKQMEEAEARYRSRVSMGLA